MGQDKPQQGMQAKASNGPGRPPLAEGEDSQEVPVRFPKSMLALIDEKVAHINERGYEVKRSELIRMLVGYRIGNAIQVFKEVKMQEKSL